MSDLSEQIITDAAKAKTVTHGGTTLTRRDIGEQIEADRYAEEKAVAQNMGRTVKSLFSRIVPPGGH
jgi:hypothetical protein